MDNLISKLGYLKLNDQNNILDLITNKLHELNISNEETINELVDGIERIDINNDKLEIGHKSGFIFTIDLLCAIKYNSSLNNFYPKYIESF